jgi:hypothetical protein
LLQELKERRLEVLKFHNASPRGRVGIERDYCVLIVRITAAFSR